MFWRKVECDGCNARIQKRGAIFHRGSYFCSEPCRAGWEQRNPPRVAAGDPSELRRNLIQTIDCALDEYGRSRASATPEQLMARVMPVVGRTQAQYQAKDRAEQFQRFIEYAHECVPMARALGYQDEIVVLEKLGFGATMPDVVAALERARERAAAQ